MIEKDHVLLVRRNREPMLGEWSVPGGAVETGETLEEAIVREVREETGLTVTPTAMLKTFDRIAHDSTGRVRFHYVLIDFYCRLVPTAETLRPASDVSDARWVPFKTLRQSKEFILPDWTLEVVEEGWRQAHDD